jgi:anti-sigma factor RsiW
MALVPCPGDELPGLSTDVIREAERHLRACVDCRSKVSRYRQLVNRSFSAEPPAMAPRRADCAKDNEVDWCEVVAGQLPELKARQLITHAALCDHCGPLLRAAASVNYEVSLAKEGPVGKERQTDVVEPEWFLGFRWLVMRWLVPAARLVIEGILGAIRMASRGPHSESNFAEIAVHKHRERARGSLALDFRSESQQALNDWFEERLPFSLVLPASTALPGEHWPFRLDGARLVQVRGKAAALIGYEMKSGPVSLVVAPDSIAVASGGVEINFKRVSFHYRMIEGYKVVTWSAHGLTYALVSQEGNGTQQSCMVCHSVMRDRDLSQTPTPLPLARNPIQPVLQ